MFTPLRHLLLALTICAALISQTGCGDEMECTIHPWGPVVCPDIFVHAAFVNECVDSATALQVKIKAAHPDLVFPDWTRWTDVPIWTDTVVIDSIGMFEYCVTFELDPHRFILRGEEAGVGIELLAGYQVLIKQAAFLRDTVAVGKTGKWTELPATTSCGDAAPCPRASAVGVLVDYDLSAGLELDVFNSNDDPLAGPVVLAELQWTTAPDTLADSNLVWGDSLLEALPWTSPETSLPMTLLPGQPPMVYDIPDAEVLTADVVLIRVHSYSQTVEMRGIFQGDLTQAGTQVDPHPAPSFLLLRSYPDPFSESTTIEYELQDTGDVTLTIYDIRGKRLARIDKPRTLPGRHTVTWPGSDERGRKITSGVYFCRLQVGRHSETTKMIIVR